MRDPPRPKRDQRERSDPRPRSDEPRPRSDDPRPRSDEPRPRSDDPRPRSDHHRDRNGDHRHRDDGVYDSDRTSSRPPYYPGEDERPHKHSRDVRRGERSESKCTHMCSRRGLVLICTVLTNGLVLICLVATQMVVSGMTSRGFDINSHVSLQGTELQQVRELDMQYSQMRAPGLYGGIPFSLVMGVVSLLLVVAGNKPPHLLAPKLLASALAFQALGAAAYVTAVGLYLHFVIRVNATDVCQRRERIYGRNGYTWMNCDVSGGDAAVALFGLITAILYAIGAAFTVQTIRGVRRYRRERERWEEEEKKQQARPPQRAPLRDTFV
ncbi:MARVEL domain-containing protein 3 [Cololabis saira]|uniref:MARVEL domain-containing protein 3 n=1 Tax=Cololabis saira TaxID=129043 RepID=UPI002AD3936E|nr:MARVEL domain-containing protein 3 [Cololabis saira]